MFGSQVIFNLNLAQKVVGCMNRMQLSSGPGIFLLQHMPVLRLTKPPVQ
jgi:hypothetical protein